MTLIIVIFGTTGQKKTYFDQVRLSRPLHTTNGTVANDIGYNGRSKRCTKPPWSQNRAYCRMKDTLQSSKNQNNSNKYLFIFSQPNNGVILKQKRYWLFTGPYIKLNTYWCVSFVPSTRIQFELYQSHVVVVDERNNLSNSIRYRLKLAFVLFCHAHKFLIQWTKVNRIVCVCVCVCVCWSCT